MKGDGALVMYQRTPGLHIRTDPADAGLSLGYSERICILSDEDYDIVSGWKYFVYSAPNKAECYAMDLSTYGLEFRLGCPDTSFTLGVRHTTVMAKIPGDTAQVLHIDFNRSNPAAVFLRHSKTKKGGIYE